MATTQGSKPAAQAAKPVAQPLKQEPPKTVTNDTTTSTNPANAELQPKLPINTNIGEKPIAITEDNLGKIEEKFVEDLSKILKLDKEEPSLQNEKNLQEELKEFIQPKVQMPTAGRIVTFFFAKEDSICTNNMVPSLPATVVLTEGLITNLAVFTLDSRDPVVLRKAVPHVSIAQKDSEDAPIKPYWD